MAKDTKEANKEVSRQVSTQQISVEGRVPVIQQKLNAVGQEDTDAKDHATLITLAVNDNGKNQTERMSQQSKRITDKEGRKVTENLKDQQAAGQDDKEEWAKIYNDASSYE